MKSLTITLILLLVALFAGAQSLPQELLATRSVVIYPKQVVSTELKKFQEYFQRIGVDAVLYVQAEAFGANESVKRAFAETFQKREIKNLLIIDRHADGFQLQILAFDGYPIKQTGGWLRKENSISILMQELYRQATGGQKRKNLLISDTPETEYRIQFIKGRRNDYYALDLKIDALAVILTGNVQNDDVITRFFQAQYPFKYTLFPPGTDLKTVRDKGHLYVFDFLYSTNRISRQLLDFEPMNMKNYVSYFFQDKTPAERIISAESMVYKVYFIQLVNENLYVGSKWDSDPDLEQALTNHITALKIQLKVP